jgi:hypothetical protein
MGASKHFFQLAIFLGLVLALTSASLQKNKYLDGLADLEEELGQRSVFSKDSEEAENPPKLFDDYLNYYGPDFRSSSEKNCSSFSTCSNCLSSIYCGWCSGLNKCLAATNSSSYELESDDATCNASLGWHVHAQDCRNCSIYNDCKSCVNAYNQNNTHANKSANWNGCGWCGDSSKGSGHCFEGTSQGPYQAVTNTPSCPSVSQMTQNTTNSNWRFDAESCPSNSDDEKRKLAIIIGLSVAGGLFVLAVIATIVFIIVKRYRHKYSEYGPINDDVA